MGGITINESAKCPLRMLIVEDELLILIYLEPILDGGHVVVRVAPDMHIVIAIAAREKIDAVVMYVDLARGATGFEASRIPRETTPCPR